MESVVLSEEFARLDAPMRADFFGDTLVGPTILEWGSEEQKSFFLPKILRGAIAWCQGFSEPDAGSDLASLKTRAELDGDEWVINGQKVWTTQAQYADYVFLLARTDTDAPKHKGISYLLVPMRAEGIDVRPHGLHHICCEALAIRLVRVEECEAGIEAAPDQSDSRFNFEQGIEVVQDRV